MLALVLQGHWHHHMHSGDACLVLEVLDNIERYSLLFLMCYSVVLVPEISISACPISLLLCRRNTSLV